MKSVKRNKVPRNFFANSFMLRLTAPCDSIAMCENIRDLLVKINNVFLLASVSEADYWLLDETIQCTEKMFKGEERDELFDLFYRLGVILLDLGEEDLGVTCQYLHHNYKNRTKTSWPPAKAYCSGRGAEVKKLLPILARDQGFWEKDTNIDLKSIPR